MQHSSSFSSPPDLRQFAALVAVAEQGSISAASSHLGWSDATVNYHLRNLESTLGATLLNRSKRGTTPTPIAKQLIPQAKAALNTASQALETVLNSAAGRLPELRLGLFPTAASHLLPRITRRLRGADFSVQAILAEVSTLEHRFRARELDAALIFSTPGKNNWRADGVTQKLVIAEDVLLAVPTIHRFARRSQISTAELLETAEDAWILGSSAPDPLDEMLLQIFAGQQAALNVRIRTDDYSVALGMVAAGLAVTTVPRLACRNVPNGVHLVGLVDARFKREISLLLPTERTALNSEQLETLSRAVSAAANELTEPV
ncbi:LysR family transcriptional regulator [Canibacter zhoujuaniae]|uniref:LysR family transcriptional regulator n=1 Tax=Canibacter zhoujuaniae TaxID=2708343 RepID=UPI00142065A3|nr:LysR family transcriptional regulator [Canibacter zhoujuaniae]